MTPPTIPKPRLKNLLKTCIVLRQLSQEMADPYSTTSVLEKQFRTSVLLPSSGPISPGASGTLLKILYKL